jgi:CobQ-like glutamine amidotransferase family enzyme
MTTKLTIGYFYKQQLNLYGDNGNVEILTVRALRRNMYVDVVHIDTELRVNSKMMADLDIVFMGGGPDSGQKEVYKDLLNKKGDYLQEYIENGGVGLFICGAYQLLGHYYKADDGTFLEGLGIYDMYTQHFGGRKARCVGNVVATLNKQLVTDPVFASVNFLTDKIVGFCNHGGRTYLADSMVPLAKVDKGYGNNGEDSGEGVWYKNTFGTYFHGPFLARNAHIADYLLAKSKGMDELARLDNSLVLAAHTASHKVK